MLDQINEILQNTTITPATAAVKLFVSFCWELLLV